jgi:hypothetical protein
MRDISIFREQNLPSTVSYGDSPNRPSQISLHSQGRVYFDGSADSKTRDLVVLNPLHRHETVKSDNTVEKDEAEMGLSNPYYSLVHVIVENGCNNSTFVPVSPADKGRASHEL